MLNEPVSYTNWHSYEPNNSGYGTGDVGDCVVISSGNWHDTWCFRTFHALCSLRHSIGKCLESQ